MDQMPTQIMRFSFTSETVDPSGSKFADPDRSDTLFRLYLGTEEIGRFQGNISQGQYVLDGDRYTIVKRPHLFRKDEYTLLRNAQPYLQDMFTIPAFLIGRGFEATMELPTARFHAKREKTGIRYTPFKKSTWGHFRMTLSDGHRSLDFRFRRAYKHVIHLVPHYLPMEGEITGDINDLSVILPGFYLILRLLDYEDVT